MGAARRKVGERAATVAMRLTPCTCLAADFQSVWPGDGLTYTNLWLHKANCRRRHAGLDAYRHAAEAYRAARRDKRQGRVLR